MKLGVESLSRKCEALARQGMVRLLSGVIPLYVINEYPRSGGTWVGRLLSSALDVPFPVKRYPVVRPSVMHGHYLNPRGIKNTVVVWRDGRDVMVSWYHHCLFFNDIGNAPLVRRTRQDVPFKDYENATENLPAFIEYAFTKQPHPGFSWSEFVRRWCEREDAVHVRYEDLHHDATGTLRRVVYELTGRRLSNERAETITDDLSFARQSGRHSGDESRGSFMRKGIVGDWRSHFSKEARETFDHCAGDELLLLGYEKDRSWTRARGGDPYLGK